MSKDTNDSFGTRMKSYEFHETSRKFIPMLPVYARIDGRGFSKFTKGMKRPFDERMSEAMIEVAKYLLEKTHARVSYVQSDEISLVWCSDTYSGEIFFDGKIQKMVSTLASMAATKMMEILFTHDDKEFVEFFKKLPHFDCRVFQLPNKIEAANSFLWREQDACKNAISMAAHHYFPHKELQNKTGSEKQEMLFSKGINFNDYPSMFRRGTFVRRVTSNRFLTDDELARIPEKHRPTGTVTRSEITGIDMPIFSKVTNRVDVIFNGADPIID